MNGDGLRIDDRLEIPRAELTTRATRSGGPGGQHVNTSSTRIELLWNARDTQALPPELRDRVLVALASRLDTDGTLRIVASESRSQHQNRLAAEERLADLVRRALVVPKQRKKTRPPRAAKEKRLQEKKRRGETKRRRQEKDYE